MRPRFMIGILLSLLLPPMLTACNTTEGFGKDVKSSGKAIEDTARDAK